MGERGVLSEGVRGMGICDKQLKYWGGDVLTVFTRLFVFKRNSLLFSKEIVSFLLLMKCKKRGYL